MCSDRDGAGAWLLDMSSPPRPPLPMPECEGVTCSPQPLCVQIATVPGRGFWACLRHLAVLYLHDNPIGDVDVLDMMSASVSVEVLTLYDTPLSLRHSYRHHVVNTLCSLKALDRRVISDEEVIEDAVFTGRFRAVDPVFAMNLCPAPVSSSLVTSVQFINSVANSCI